MAQTDSHGRSDGPILITGTTGFLGGALVRRLLASGHAPDRLRCLVRDPARAAAAGLPAASLLAGDLADPEGAPALRAAARGVALVLHLAGTLKALDRAGFDRVNRDGTERLVAAVAAVAPAAHFVLVSSLAAAGPSVDGIGSDRLPDQTEPVSLYGASKRAGELAVVRGPLPWTILRPPVVYGPGDAATRLLFRQANAPLVAVPRRPRPLSVIHADDVVDAVLAAADRRPVGAVLPLDGPERTDTHALLRTIATACGRSARLMPVPMPLAALAACCADVWGRLRGDAGFFNRDKVREIRAAGWVADGSAARTVLGVSPRVPLAAGLAAIARAGGFVRR